jgi:hypothetical protein
VLLFEVDLWNTLPKMIEAEVTRDAKEEGGRRVERLRRRVLTVCSELDHTFPDFLYDIFPGFGREGETIGRKLWIKKCEKVSKGGLISQQECVK